MKKIKRFAAVLLAGIMALALLTACGGSGSDNPEFDAKVESAYLDALNKAFGKTMTPSGRWLLPTSPRKAARTA